MNRFGVRVLLVLLLVSFGVFYGVDIATRGTERIHGSFDHQSALSNQDEEGMATVEPELPNSETADSVQEEPSLPEPPLPERIPPYNEERWARLIGKTLQKLAHGIVESVVSIFETLLRF